ncbi:MAG: hypothetical protein ABIT64_06500 [Lysobacteraceae bacterium]
MPSRIDPRSWLLIAIAGWALLCAIVAVAGFGGRYQLLPDDPSQLPSLPGIALADARSPLGPIESYAAASDRPLFYPDRKPISVHIEGNGSAGHPLNVALTSVIITPTLQMVIVQDNDSHQSFRARQGQPLEGDYAAWRLVAIAPRSAVFDGGTQGKQTLQLRVFDGHGGVQPTPIGLTPQVVAGGALGPLPLPSMATPNAGLPPMPNAKQSPSAVATLAAAEAERQAEQIRQRIEQRRLQAQSQSDDTPQPNDKR